MKTLYIIRKDGIRQRYRVKNLKRFKSTRGYDKKSRAWRTVVPVKEIPPERLGGKIAWEVVTQTSANTRGENPKSGHFESEFSYNANGVFASRPTPEQLERMTKAALLRAFNSGNNPKKRYIQHGLFDILTGSNAVRGFEIREVIDKPVTNRLDLKLKIKRNGVKWESKD